MSNAMRRIEDDDSRTNRRWLIVFVISAFLAIGFGYWYSQRWAGIRMDAIHKRDSAQGHPTAQ